MVSLASGLEVDVRRRVAAVRELGRNRGADLGRVVADVRDVLGRQPALLARADVDHRRAEERALLMPADELPTRQAACASSGDEIIRPARW